MGVQACHEFRGQLAQAIIVNAPCPPDVAIRQIPGRKLHMFGKILIPKGATVGGDDNLFNNRFAGGLIGR